MKFLTPSSLVLSLWTAGFASADFHIMESANNIINTKLAIPSNKYNCDGIKYSLGLNEIDGSIGSSYMSMRDGDLCGAKNLDFYKQNDGSYKFYTAGGDGSVQGQCYHNEASKGVIDNCWESLYPYDEKLICYTYLCK
ncbi:hypothetical protein V8C35DRAFT_278234 [Trichoderma chlorosporum]